LLNRFGVVFLWMTGFVTCRLRAGAGRKWQSHKNCCVKVSGL
jgi:hypothetical protein